MELGSWILKENKISFSQIGPLPTTWLPSQKLSTMLREKLGLGEATSAMNFMFHGRVLIVWLDSLSDSAEVHCLQKRTFQKRFRDTKTDHINAPNFNHVQGL